VEAVVVTRREKADRKESGMEALERALARLRNEIADTQTETTLIRARLVDPQNGLPRG